MSISTDENLFTALQVRWNKGPIPSLVGGGDWCELADPCHGDVIEL